MEGFRFKTVVMGTSDKLKAEFINLISQRSWAVDGVSGHIYERNQVAMDIWFPKENASSKILVSFSYQDINGVIIVMGRRDNRILNRCKRKIRQEVGSIPYVGVVIRSTMSENEKALRSLHAMKILCERMKEIALESTARIKKKEEPPPRAIAGEPNYVIDEFGFIIPGSEEGVPIFVEASEETDSPKKKLKGKTSSSNYK